MNRRTGLGGWIGLAAVGLALSTAAEPPCAPSQGCYLGAVLDWGDLATAVPDRPAAASFAAGMREFNEAAGKPHALFEQFFFFPHGATWEDKKVSGQFCRWDSDPCGWATPKDFASACDEVGATPVMTIEPHVFAPFYTDWREGNPAFDETLAFARKLGEWGKPAFIRFAHEMNGSWYAWATWADKNKNLRRDRGEETGVTPEMYRAAYRNFASMVRRHAPNAILVWCPNQGWLGEDGRDQYTPFYPGDDVVDWVGVDFYERGFYLPHPKSHLYGGTFQLGLQKDDADNPATEADESVNFYKTYFLEKGKPILVCETGAELTHRSDLKPAERRDVSHQWKAGWWNAAEYGWLFQVFGTSHYTGRELRYPIDRQLPGVKGIIWFHQAKKESFPSIRKKKWVGPGASEARDIVWFDDAWCDFRIGANTTAPEQKKSAEFPAERRLHHELIDNPYFLSRIEKTPEP